LCTETSEFTVRMRGILTKMCCRDLGRTPWVSPDGIPWPCFLWGHD
jgi:hypothetical protein